MVLGGREVREVRVVRSGLWVLINSNQNTSFFCVNYRETCCLSNLTFGSVGSVRAESTVAAISAVTTEAAVAAVAALRAIDMHVAYSLDCVSTIRSDNVHILSVIARIVFAIVVVDRFLPCAGFNAFVLRFVVDGAFGLLLLLLVGAN